MLLMLGGISMQRTMIETRATQLSRDASQAFYRADGALDAALARIKREYLLDGYPYEVTTPLGVATFELETLSAEVNSTEYQRLIRRIIAKTPTGTSATKSVMGYVEEIAPVNGLWGNGMVVTHGGLTSLPKFVKGTMRSKDGVMTSRADSGELAMDGATYAEDKDQLDADWISDELRSVKNGYKCLKLNTCVGPLSIDIGHFLGIGDTGNMFTLRGALPSTTGENHVGVRFNTTSDPLPKPHQQTLPPATGALNIGAITDFIPHGVLDVCSTGNLELPAGSTTVIDADDQTLPPGTVVTNGKITMCVNAITPQDDEVWLNTLINEPPELVFNDYALVVLTGTKHYDLSTSDYEVYSETYNMNVPVKTALPYAGVQYDWYVTVAAKISAPKGLFLLVADQPSPAPGATSVVWLKPGRDFNVQVHAPQSLVVVRERDGAEPGFVVPAGFTGYVGDQLYQNGQLVPLKFQSIVGNEVIVELNEDAVEVGLGPKNPKHSTTTLLGWQEGI